MVKGQRAHSLTKAELVSRLVTSGAYPLNFEVTEDAPLLQLLGHAIFYRLLTQLEIDETTPRNETTLPCYLRSFVSDPIDLARIDRYVEASSDASRRGSMILNQMAQQICGPRLPGAKVFGFDVPVFRPRFEAGPVLESMQSFVDMWWDFDHGIEDSTLKHAFMPERWGTEARQSIIDIVAKPGSLLPPEPTGWRNVMIGDCISGWDNAINRMMTRYFGNVKVQAMKGVKDAIAAYFRVVPLIEPNMRGLLIDTMMTRPRPLIANNDDYEMAMKFRTALVADSNSFMPKDAAWSKEVFLIHIFLTRFGVRERSYLPVVTPGRHFTYVDSKIAAGLFPLASSKMRAFESLAKKTRKTNLFLQELKTKETTAVEEAGSSRYEGVNVMTTSSPKKLTAVQAANDAARMEARATKEAIKASKDADKAVKAATTAMIKSEKLRIKEEAKAAAAAAAPGKKKLTAAQAAKEITRMEVNAAKERARAEDRAADEAAMVASGPQLMPVTPTLGQLMDMTPEAFNARRKVLMRQIHKSNKTKATSKAFLNEKQRTRFKRQIKHRRSVGCGKMNLMTRFDSFETDTVGLRLVLKMAIDINKYVLPITEDVKFKPKIKEPKLMSRTHKISKKAAQINAMNAELAQPTDPRLAGAIIVGIDEGRAKLFTAAFEKKKGDVSEHDGFESLTLTRNKYNAVTKLKIRRKWEKKRLDAAPGLEAAHAALSLGSLHSCDPEAWSRYLTAESKHRDIMRADYFGEDKGRELWKMIAFRKKKACLDRAVGEIVSKATKGEHKSRPLVIGIGDAAFPPNGPRGEIAVPTSKLAAAYKRAFARERRKGRLVVSLPISEMYTTKACCKCGMETVPPDVTRKWKTKDGELKTAQGPSRRLRCCTTCTPIGKLRDRDVQAARNMFHATKALICGEARPAHLCAAAHPKKVPSASPSMVETQPHALRLIENTLAISGVSS